MAGGAARASYLSDILAAQPSDAARLAEVYDLEHDAITDDLVFYREWASRVGGSVVDLGCGSGRLFGAFLAGGARHIVGIDGSPALIDRAARRVAADEALRAARDAGRIELTVADVRTVARADRFTLAVLAGVVSHLDGPAGATRALRCAKTLLEPDGVLVVDVLGPAGVPSRDLPMSVDWERRMGDRRVVRRSRIERSEAADGVRVLYATLTEIEDADGTIARLPARFPLWYPSPSVLLALAEGAGLTVEATFGSHDLDPLEDDSDRCIAVLRRAAATPRRG